MTKFWFFETEQIDFGHFKNVHFRKRPSEIFEKVVFLILEHNALISVFCWKYLLA